MNLRKMKLLRLFYFVSVVIIVTACSESKQEQASKQILMSDVQLKNMALKRCQPKLKKAIGREMFAATETTGIGTSSLVLKWTGEKDKDEFKIALCSYSMDHGLTSIVIDGKIVFEKKI